MSRVLPLPEKAFHLDPRRLSVRETARVWTWLGEDLFRRWAPPVVARVALVASKAARSVSWRSHVRWLMISQRLSPSAAKTVELREVLQDHRTDFLSLLPDDVSWRQAVKRSIVLRPPRVRAGRLEAGVLLVKFTETLRYFAHHIDVAGLQRYFRLVVEPSWAGYALPELLFLTNLDAPVLVEAAEVTDRELLAGLKSSLVPIPLGSGEWVDHRVFTPLGGKKEFDAVYVANYSTMKRVPAFLRAVRRVLDHGAEFRAALICSKWGGKREEVLNFVNWYGIADQVAIYESLSQPEVNEVLNRSRCSVLMSLKEGSNRSLFESMFAGTPALLIAENVGVNRAHFTRMSGEVVPERELPGALRRMATAYESFQPREWAMEHISPEMSTRKVEEALSRLFPEDEGNAHLLVKVNAPEARYLDESLRGVQGSVSGEVLSLFPRGRGRPEVDAVLRAVEPLSG